ncbi:hypothetical protein CF060_13665 [Clostridium botulinum]|nr:hypothetical protein RSJ10_439 [Clostridium botulinum]AUM97759.1 hypothetical protein RSJ13_01445 [Clostridium botulinum]MBN3355481.1 hypothetical protein [Clostridium botulinum]QDY27549.1 hypothetical protein CGQ41_01480 [Clostridium botulinum]
MLRLHHEIHDSDCRGFFIFYFNILNIGVKLIIIYTDFKIVIKLKIEVIYYIIMNKKSCKEVGVK